ncbi:MAG: SdrD B-like domain-containing protein, partial [Clostridia bacterium]|nr:SdrD B-like domain-containing protein [Clostridia bacterium]
ALSAEPEVFLTVEPYLSEGGQVTRVCMTSVRMPESEEMDAPCELYAAREQGLTLISFDTGALSEGETLLVPQVTLKVTAEGGERVNLTSLVLGSASDAQGDAYTARVEYCLAGGGWQPSDARVTGELNAPTAVSLSDVEGDISALRVTYIHAQTGEEAAGEGFCPGQLTVNARVGTQNDAMLHAEAELSGLFVYRKAWDEEENVMRRASAFELSFEAEGDGAFETVSAGRDGSVSGMAFFDENADGVLSVWETGRYAGMTVSLINQSGAVIDSCRTDAEGRYAFTSVSGGVYTVQFEAGSGVVYSSGSRYTEHAVSGVQDTRYGVSAPIVIDGDHTDYVVNAGCIYASELNGSVMERGADGHLSAYSGLGVEMRSVSGKADEEPTVVVTDGSGHYGFTGVLPGDYEVTLRVPQGFLCEEAEDGAIVRYASFEQGDEISFGQTIIARQAQISGRVMIDDDGDGVIAEGAGALGGVKVALLRVEEGHTEQIAQTTADENGYYAFDGLYAGDYSVLFELSGDWTFTRYGEGSCVYGAVSQSGSSREFSLIPGEHLEGMDAGVTLPAQLSVTVFQDTQFDGQKGAYEQGLEGASVSLIRLENGEDAEAISYRTDEEGSVVFAGVSPGEYVLEYQLPGLWRATIQVDPKTTQYPVSCVPQSTSSTGRSEPFTLTMGQSGVRLYIGAMLSGSISGTVYDDVNDDAKLDDSEEFFAGVLVELLDTQDGVLAERVTGESGSYSFEGLAPGRYRVRFTAPDGCAFSGTEKTAAKGGVQESESEVSTTKLIAVTAGEATAGADAGVVRLCEAAGVLWEDRNADGLWNEGESALEGVSVQLMNGAGHTVLETAQTDENGAFSFGRLRPNTYKLRIDAPEGYVFSGELSGSALPLESERDGRGYSAAFTLLGGVRAEGIGFGLLTQGSIGGRVFVDDNYDGLMDEGEDGLRGVSVALYNGQGEQVAQTETVRSGEFQFAELMPGEYTLFVTLEEGYVFTAGGGDSLAPRSNESVARVELGELEMGGAMTDVYTGALKPAAIGGTVFMDTDDDGRRQSGDAGLSGVRVTLDVLEGTDAGLRMETETDALGAYRFDGVMPGRVKLSFDIPDGYAFAKNAKGTRYVSVVPQTDALNASVDALDVVAAKDQLGLDVGIVGVGTVAGTVWEDGDYDGARGTSERGVAGARVALVDAKSGTELKTVITGEDGAYVLDFVRVGEYTLQIGLPEGMIFTREGESMVAMADTAEAQTSSFALGMGESASGCDFGAIVPASVSGEIYTDTSENNVRDAGEEGLSGAVVTLMQGGTAIATVSTDIHGGFSFGLLRPGAYRVRVTLPDDALFTKETPLRVSYADAQEGETGEFELETGRQLSMEPVGAVKAARIAGRAWSDENADGMMDAAEPALSGVTVELLAAGNVVASAQTGEDGQYAFELLRSGEYAVRFTLPQGMLLADRVAGGASSVDVVPGCSGTTQSFMLSQGEARGDLHIGGILPGRIGDTVWLDENGNGLQDYKEPLLSGVSITLLRVLEDGRTQEVSQTQSDEYGYYSFSDLRPGSYVLRVNTREGDELTMRFGEPLGEIDSDADP